jgi:hypothetical protein
MPNGLASVGRPSMDFVRRTLASSADDDCEAGLLKRAGFRGGGSSGGVAGVAKVSGTDAGCWRHGVRSLLSGRGGR